jgi:hypothetical protein
MYIIIKLKITFKNISKRTDIHPFATKISGLCDNTMSTSFIKHVLPDSGQLALYTDSKHNSL